MLAKKTKTSAAGEAEIGYILKGYGRTSETFITNEIMLLEKEGVPLSIFSVKRLEGQKQHGAIGRIRAPITYLPEAAPLDEENFARWLWKNLPGFFASHRTLFLRSPGRYLAALSESLGMCVKHRRSPIALPRKVFFKEFLQAGFIAQRALESGRIRHLHAHFCHGVTTIAMFAARLSGLPFSFTAHAKDIYQSDLNPGDLLSTKMRRAEFVLTCTGANKTHLDSIRPAETPLHTIYHGLDLSLFVPAPETDRETAAKDTPVILSVGRMVEKKGFTDLVEACRLLRERDVRFACRIVGGADKYTEAIERAIREAGLEETVTLHHAVTQEELRRIYQESTIFALPCQVLENGDRDGIPNVLVEAMAMELPVVSTDISGIPELIEDGVNGRLTPQRNPRALADAIEELLQAPELRRQYGRAAREKVCRLFDAGKNVIAIKRLFLNSLASRENSRITEPSINETADRAGHLSTSA
ncbi:MAG: glycosyltransferase family 4 protein [Blastocatellia bacterium]|nr:glycosyltransferase family 4 protein [Blastocatellia bacterium]